MKRFLIISCSLMVLVLALAVAAFVYVQMALAPEDSVEVSEDGVLPSASNTTVPRDTEPVSVNESVEETAPEPTEATTPVLSEPIPLSSLPLSDTQKDLLRGAGIDPETFVITPEMVICAEDRLGAARFAEIVAGDAPGPTEVFSLLRCL